MKQQIMECSQETDYLLRDSAVYICSDPREIRMEFRKARHNVGISYVGTWQNYKVER